jgi:hypothetical protein
MTSLAEHQRALLDLMRGRAPAARGDPYLARVAGSRELAFLREVSLFWCAVGVRSTCPWTARWLDRQGAFNDAIVAFHSGEDVSPYIETAGRQFLARFLTHPDPLAAALAAFELALLRVQAGETGVFRCDWPCNPDAVILALRTDGALPAAEPDRIYRLEISRAFSELMRCEVVEAA